MPHITRNFISSAATETNTVESCQLRIPTSDDELVIGLGAPVRHRYRRIKFRNSHTDPTRDSRCTGAADTAARTLCSRLTPSSACRSLPLNYPGGAPPYRNSPSELRQTAFKLCGRNSSSTRSDQQVERLAVPLGAEASCNPILKIVLDSAIEDVHRASGLEVGNSTLLKSER